MAFGSVELAGISGSVDGRAVNGRIEATFAGDRLPGEDIDLTTVNGPVDLRIPRGVSAQLELETVIGRMDADLPGTSSGGTP